MTPTAPFGNKFSVIATTPCLPSCACACTQGRYPVYEVRPRKDKRGVDLISDALPFGRLWYDTPDNAIAYAMHNSRSQDAVIRV